jgi:tetratricopeptide (TPR) repeat protein
METSDKGKTSLFWLLVVILLCWGSCFVLACRLTSPEMESASEVDSVLGRLLGASRVALGQSLYLEADNYFHQGVKHTQKTAFTDFFQRWDSIIAPQLHMHTAGTSIYELMPWFRFATEMDPHNVEAYLTAAYWLGNEGGRPDLAEKILMEGQQNNPRDYRILQEKGRLLLREHKDEPAAAALSLGLRLWPSGQDPKDEQTVLDLAQMLTLRGCIYAQTGDRQSALVLLQKAWNLFPANKALAARVRDLQQGADLRLGSWAEIFPQKHVCSREEHDEHDHEHDDD